MFSALALLLPAPVLAVSPAQPPLVVAVIAGMPEIAHQADPAAAAAAGLSVRRVCSIGGPSMFSGRSRRENCQTMVVQPRCRSSAPSMFSGRGHSSECVVEMARPQLAESHAPAIFSGHARRPASKYAPPTVSYTVAADGTATPQVTYRTTEEVKKAHVPPRLPTMFTGRRRRATQ